MRKQKRQQWIEKCLRDAQAAERMATMAPTEGMRAFHLKAAAGYRQVAAEMQAGK